MPKLSGFLYDKNAKVVRLPLSSREFLSGIRLFSAVYRETNKNHKPDIIIATTWKVLIPLLVLRHLVQAPILLVCHGAEITRHRNNAFLMFLMRKVIKMADQIICVSEYTKGILKKYSNVELENVTVIPNGIDLTRINRYEKQVAREKLSLPKDASILLTVSRIDHRKGHEKVIRLLPELKKSHPKLYYVVVGDGPLKKDLENLVDRLGLTEKDVLFTGFVTDLELQLYYSSCDLFIMINTMDSEEDFEGFGFVFAEAGAYGKPAIGGDNSGPREVIEHESSGYLVKSDDKEALSGYIQKLLNDRTLLHQMGKNAKERVDQSFTLDRMIQRFKHVVNHCVHNNQSAKD